MRGPRKADVATPEWSLRIESFRQMRKVSQAEFGRQLGVSAMAVSRWERGVAELSAETYIRLGNLANNSLCWFFWKRAGLQLSDVMRVLPEAHRRLAESRISDVRVVRAGSGKKHSWKIRKPRCYTLPSSSSRHARLSGRQY